MTQELLQDHTEKYSNKISLFAEDLFPVLNRPQRSNSDPSSIITINTSLNNSERNAQNTTLINLQNNLTIQLQNKNMSFIEDDKNNQVNLDNDNDNYNNNNPINKSHMSLNFFNSNFYGFKGRSPYATPNLNNIVNNSININNNIKNNNKNNAKNNTKNDIIGKVNAINKNQKRGDTALITQLKDKILEYRCSVCNFIATENEELHKHLVLKKHFTFPKKMKKLKKPKIFFKIENKNNQSFMYSISKSFNHKKIFDKKIICRYCSKKFDSIYSLNCHLNAHNYRCDNCYKLFNNKEDLIKHNEMELIYSFKKINLNKKKEFKSPGKKVKMEIDDWEEISSNKKERWESDEELSKNNDIEQSYAFIEDSDDNFDFNKMVKINDK